MEVREIDGKKFIEFDEHKKERKRFIVSILFLLLMVIAIVALINSTATLLKNKDIIVSDPLVYGMNVHNFTSCACYDNSGREWNSFENGFILSSNARTSFEEFKFEVGKIGQAEIIECLEKHKTPISRKQIADELNCDPISVSHSIKKLLKKKEIKCVEMDRIQAGLMLGLGRPFRRTRFYYL